MLTDEQRENLLLAIERAKDSGACRYVKNGEPCCVIGQYAYLTGVPIETLEEWDRSGHAGSSLNVWFLISNGGYSPGLSADFLWAIQRVWDGGGEDEDTLR